MSCRVRPLPQHLERLAQHRGRLPAASQRPSGGCFRRCHEKLRRRLACQKRRPLLLNDLDIRAAGTNIQWLSRSRQARTVERQQHRQTRAGPDGKGQPADRPAFRSQRSRPGPRVAGVMSESGERSRVVAPASNVVVQKRELRFENAESDLSMQKKPGSRAAAASGRHTVGSSRMMSVLVRDLPLIAWYIGVLVFLEGLLSADNALVLAVMVRHLSRQDRRRVLQWGIWGARSGFRVVAVLLSTILLKLWLFQGLQEASISPVSRDFALLDARSCRPRGWAAGIESTRMAARFLGNRRLGHRRRHRLLDRLDLRRGCHGR